MKAIKFCLAFIAMSFFARAQQKKVSLNTPKPVETVAHSGLQTNNDGLPIEMAVLRYNDSVLAIQPNEVNNTFLGFDTKNNDMKFLKGHGFTIYFPSNRLKTSEVLELVSTYGFTLKNDFLSKVISQNAIDWKTLKLPTYLSFSIEEIRLK